jgi:hypothetical protein
MSVIFRLTTRDKGTRQTCCLCSRPIESDPVELYVFWPGDEDPTAWFAHDACIARDTSIRRSAAAGESETGTA